MNRRGDVPITILVIGVFVVCTLALLSFIYANVIMKKSFVGVDIMEKANSDIEKNSLSNYHDEEIDEGFWFWEKEKLIFSVEYQKP